MARIEYDEIALHLLHIKPASLKPNRVLLSDEWKLSNSEFSKFAAFQYQLVLTV